MSRDFIKDVLLGVSAGDALGVPVEFRSRAEMGKNPLTGIIGFGTHQQPPGTWSDDSSLTFCLTEMLCGEYDLDDLGRRFINWKNYGYWTPHGHVFDIGIATNAAINRLERGVSPVMAGGKEEGSNGNGALMRILPLVFYVRNKDITRRFEIVKEVSSLTHRHIRSVIACFIYLEIALEIMAGKDKHDAYRQASGLVSEFLIKNNADNKTEHAWFARCLGGDLFRSYQEDIHSSGYVVHTLEAAIWCFLNTCNYEDAVLKAVNLGDDTDTTAAVTGGLAGLHYGWQTIPQEWLAVLARKSDIEELSDRLNAKLK